ncbi:MAG: carboxylating nicotinate-nucleotide diphosphorylase [Alphaproteobacteria bacterium]|jgi:nicotinate-nucleotide pyrophosphorylase (carboxylating)|nr:carboxylating nicotinate-nucleotide diphosphorylase [Alphaproteobacteria bacterium]MBT7943105.1 carboxylating nicotinate-nucleotide diphosphorylase [Alphaproteobacteria bacterium]
MPSPDPADIKTAVDAALAEDLGQGDITTNAVIPGDTRLKLVLTTRQDIVLAGLPVAVEVFSRLAPDADLTLEAADGDTLTARAVIARLEGPAAGLLSAERTALNILQTLSGIATLTRAFVERISGTGAVLLDTRKTLPGLRSLSKYASRTGGATNHRMRLDDGVLIKDNHIAVAGSAGEATRRAKAAGLENVEVECDTLAQVKEAIAAGADSLLLDNMPPDMLALAVQLVGGAMPLEASGGVNLETIRAIAETGVNYISVGAITQSAPAVDIGLDLET